MPRKTEGTTSRTKKTSPPTEAAGVQPVPAQVAPNTRSAEARSPEIRSTEVRGAAVRDEVRDNVTPINVAPMNPAAKKAQASPANLDQINLDEEIRRRAYELFLERKGVAGDPAADWFVAEREVRARYAGKDSAFAARQGS
jgi:Protein of unknown function (DUF2934)